MLTDLLKLSFYQGADMPMSESFGDNHENGVCSSHDHMISLPDPVLGTSSLVI